MTTDNGKHDHRTLETGETVYLTKDPGCNWGIKQYDCPWGRNWLPGPEGVPCELKTKTVFAQDMGWEDLRFDTKDEAYAFIAKHLSSKQDQIETERN